MRFKRKFNQIPKFQLLIVSILTHFSIFGESAHFPTAQGQEAETPCIMTRDAACLGYPWSGMECIPEDPCLLRGQSEAEIPVPLGDPGTLTSVSGMGTSEDLPVGTMPSSGLSYSSGTGVVGGGRTGVGAELPLYSPTEERYHYWDSAFRACIPGFGRPLPASSEKWTWQAMPGGTLYRAHFASNRESRLGIHFINEDTTHDSYWDPTLGGRINFLRYGTTSRIYPEGFQLDLECAAIARLTLTGDRDLHGTDYRVGAPLTFRKENWELKLGYYHISSHMGDEWIVKNYEKTGEVYRINYVRDCLTWGIAFRPDANWRFYFGGDYVFNRDGGAKPWQFELGAEYSPMMLPNFQGSPFLALHFRWSEDTDFETYSALEAGWQWKTVYQHTMRTGLYAMAGHADQYQFYDRWEKQIGFGFWYDF